MSINNNAKHCIGVQLFITCIMDTLYPEIGEAVVRVLERAGACVEFPSEQTCCGQPAFNAGMRKQARPIARHTIQVFEKTEGPIVVPSGSCTAMIRHGYMELFSDDPNWLERARNIAERTYEFTEFLVDYLGVTDLGARYPGKLTYHSSCHLLRDLGVDRQPRALLAAVREAEFIELPHTDECCGFGGVFSVEQPEISSAMLARKIENIEISRAPLVVSCDTGCLTNINGGLHRMGKNQRVAYIAEVLDRT
jgi:L-lactate dehydrogenase complex protein LldE